MRHWRRLSSFSGTSFQMCWPSKTCPSSIFSSSSSSSMSAPSAMAMISAVLLASSTAVSSTLESPCSARSAAAAAVAARMEPPKPAPRVRPMDGEPRPEGPMRAESRAAASLFLLSSDGWGGGPMGEPECPGEPASPGESVLPMRLPRESIGEPPAPLELELFPGDSTGELGPFELPPLFCRDSGVPRLLPTETMEERLEGSLGLPACAACA
mmetsp:Transcript_9403/g.27621  ORF Transcript_9403/g.27621 Transcript_9403/m.27621 type:complete len:212 (+) Transcript_9403:3611-4246(+)